MDKFVSKGKMSKKARKRLDAENRKTWAFSPVTRKIESKKIYNRKRISRAGYGDGAGGSFFAAPRGSAPSAALDKPGRFCYHLS